MDRDEALRAVEQARDIMRGYAPMMWGEGIRRLEEALVPLSSPWGGREPLAEGGGEVHMRGDRGYITPHIKVYASDGFKDGQIVTAYVFADEGAKE